MGYYINEKGRQSELEFFIRDTGIGIPKERQKAIFDRFVKADIEDKQAYEGSGLGLAISKAYLEMLGGKIWMESVVGIGSTFYFTLPYQPERVIDKNTKDEILPLVEVSSVKKYKILIVEDDEPSMFVISMIVKKFAKEIISARNGIEAVDACLKNQDIDLILMDKQMPKLDGYEATRQIRKFNKDVIIIAQTAYALEGDKEKAIAAGCNDYISKPIKADELERKINQYLKK
jgi:CheY-like chemotaxis protein